jgi:hypothetical protein
VRDAVQGLPQTRSRIGSLSDLARGDSPDFTMRNEQLTGILQSRC